MVEARVESERTRERSAVIWLTLGLWAFVAVTFAGSILLAGGSMLSMPVMAWVGSSTITGLALSFILYQIVDRLKLKCARARWTLLIGAALVMAAVQAMMDGTLHALVTRLMGLPGRVWLEAGQFGMNALIYMGLFGFYVATLELISTTQRAAEHARASAVFATQAAEARELAREAQLQTLQLQMSPHFLFNTLNSVSSLIGAGQAEAADHMISRLSAFLRVSLQATGEGLSPLGDEIAALQAYLDVEAMRFPDTLDVEIDCPDALHGIGAPGLILQPLIEAAIQHALAAPEGERRMRLILRRDGERLIIRALDVSLVPGGTDVPDLPGLATARQRLAVIYGGAASMHVAGPDEGFLIELSLPIEC